jgi:uncharacterized membrane protein YadS
MNDHNKQADVTAPPLAPRWWQNEDWLAVIAAMPILGAVMLGWKPAWPDLSWQNAADWGRIVAATNVERMVLLTATMIALGALVLLASLGKAVIRFAFGAVVVCSLAWLAQLAAGQVSMKQWGLEYVVFALTLGLLWSHLLPRPAWLMAAVRTEFFIKTGIVLLGAGMLFGDLLQAGFPGLIQALLVIPVVWHLTFRIARWCKVDDEFAVMLSSAVSICGVSAAIAACGAIQGDKKKLSYVTSVVLLCALPMMILMPWCVKWLGLSEAVGGAWLGGTLDTSGSVLAATEMLGETATKTGTVVKLSQNVLIGLAAFALSVWWTMRDRSECKDVKTPGLRLIWDRFPKFVIGFILASLVFSFLLPAELVKDTAKTLKGWRELWFAAAFVCIGLETRLGELGALGGVRPAWAFLAGQLINILWTLLLAWWLFR